MSRKREAPTPTPVAKAAHTPGPWRRQRAVFGGTEILAGDGEAAVQIAVVDTGGLVLNRRPVAWADADLIAAAPELLDELRATADWLDERAGVLRAIAGAIARSDTQHLRDEAARFQGQAALLRLLIGKAEGRTDG